MVSSHPVLHDILDSFQWPLPVKTIAQALERPLPSYFVTGPYPFISARASSLSHNRRGERGRGCAISRTCFSRFAHVLLAFCSRGARVMVAWHAWHSFLVPLSVVPFYRPGVFERVFWGILGAGVFVVLRGGGVFAFLR